MAAALPENDAVAGDSACVPSAVSISAATALPKRIRPVSPVTSISNPLAAFCEPM